MSEVKSSTVNSIVRNTTWLFVSYAVSSFFNLFYNMYVAIYLKPESYGLFNVALAFVSIFNVLADLGVSTLATREVARDRSVAYRYFSGAVKIKMALSAITFGLVLCVAVAYGYPGETILVIALVALGNLANSFSMLFNAIYQAFEKMEFQSIGGILYSFLMLVGALYIINSGMGILAVAAMYLAANLAILVFYILVCRLAFFSPFPDLRPDRAFIANIVREGWPMGAMVLSVAIFSRIDMVMLGFMDGATAAGLYSAAFKLSDLSTAVPVMFTSAVYPVIAKYYKSSQGSFLYSYEKSMKILFYVAIPMAFAVTLLADPIILTYYKGEYSGSILALKILIWGAAGIYMTMALGNTMVAANLQRLQMKILMAMAAVNIILNYALILAYGYVGSAVAMVCTQWLMVAVYLFCLERYGFRIKLAEVFVPSAVALGVMALTWYAMAGAGLSVYVIAPVTMAEYALIVLPLGVKKDDIELIKSVIKPPGAGKNE